MAENPYKPPKDEPKRYDAVPKEEWTLGWLVLVALLATPVVIYATIIGVMRMCTRNLPGHQ